MSALNTRNTLLILVGLFTFPATDLHAQKPRPEQARATAPDFASIPKEAISRQHSFVLARDGEALFYNFDAGIIGAPFLPDVYKPFGFSADSRYFLYLKANGKIPTFSLYSYDLQTQTEEQITDESVHFATWSPAGRMLAYVALDTSNQFLLSTYDLASKKNIRIASGRIRADFIEWSPDGSELLYATVSPLSARSAEDKTFTYTLHRHAIPLGREEVVPDVAWAHFSDHRLWVTTNRTVPGLKNVANPRNEDIRKFLHRGNSVYAEVLESGRSFVKRWDVASGWVDLVEEGDLYLATDNGIVVRSFKPNVTYKYITNARQATELFAGGTNWHLPYAGFAYMVQGGSSYSSGQCDGASCFITAHIQTLGYALDWQQVPTDNQGNTHILAVEGGTVAATYNTVTCNSVTTTCHVGKDDYSANCNDPNDGAGNYIAIAHIDGTYSFYGHLKSGSVRVSAGQNVNQGAYIADQGHSGSAGTYNNYLTCGDHLHSGRQVSPGVWDQSIPTDYIELPCLLGCPNAYQSANVEIAGAPTLTSVSPNNGLASSSVPVTLTGTNFVYGSTLSISGTGITIANVQLASGTSITATLQIAAGAAAGARNLTVTTPNGTSGSVTFTVVASVQVTVSSLPSGLSLTADGVSCTSPCTLQWNPGTAHIIAAPATVSGGTGIQYVWASWSDSGALSHSVTAPSSPTTYTANFNTQYFLTTQASPAAGGSITPASAWFNSGASVSVNATANSGYIFSGFTGGITGTTTPQNVTMSAPVTVTANFATSGGGNVPWYTTGGVWTNRKLITVDHTKVSGTTALANFPLLFSVTDGNLRSTANGGNTGKTDGSDILFTVSDGVTKLDHEIESYDPVTGTLAAWVRIPSLSPTVDTGIYVYFGNAAAANQQNKTGVWDANFKGVWHLTAPSGTAISDSTTNANHGAKTSPSAPAASTGKIGGAQSFNGSTDVITVPDANSLDLTTNLTISAWINAAAWPNNYGDAIVNKEGDYALRSGDSAASQFDMLWWRTSGATRIVRTTPPSANTWHYVVGQASANDAYRIYVDGVLVASTPANWYPDTRNLTAPLTIGSSFDPSFQGVIDEVHISASVRNQDWIVSEFRNQNSSNTFYAVGLNESSTAGTQVSTPTFNPVAGNYIGTQNVVISTATPGASIRYTTDGSTPTSTTGILYGGPVNVGANTTLQAIAFKAGMTDSGVATAAYTITPAVSVTVDSSPAGQSLTVDGTACTAPCNRQWGVGTSHTIAAAATISGGTGIQYVWANWSDSGALSHSVTAPSSPTTYTANFNTQYFLTTQASPAAGGTITPASAWFNSGASASVNATANSGYTFSSFTGGLTGTTTPQSVTMTAPVTVTANFSVLVTVATPTFNPVAGSYIGAQNVAISTATSGASIRYTTDGSTPTSTTGILYGGPVNVATSTTLKAIAFKAGMTDSAVATAAYTITPAVSVTVDSSPAGQSLTVDGAACTAPCNRQWGVGTSHTIAAAATISGGAGIQYVWANWSDSGALSHSVTAPSSPTTYTANFNTQYFLTTQASPAAGGTITPASAWFNSGASVSVNATANSGYTFSGFTGGLTGTTTPQNVTMTAPVTVTANFSTSGGGGAPWYTTGGVWTNRKLITVDHTKVSGTTALSNFPLLFSVTDANLRSTANGGNTGKTDGSDILFAASDGVTKLDHELESYDPVTGAVAAWVRIPSLSPAADTGIYIYYGNAAAANQQNKTGVWDANFKAVWHLTAPSGTTISDSTTNANHGAKASSSAPTATTGKISGAQSFNGSTDVITVPDANSLDLTTNLTISAWINAAAWPNDYGNAIVNKEGNYALRSGDSAASQFDMLWWRASGATRIVRTTPPSTNTWHYVVGQASANDAYRVYVDGVLVASAPANWYPDPRNLTAALTIGSSFDPSFQGLIDEVHISASVRNQDWIVSEFRNQNSSNTFYTVGPQQ